MVARDLLPNRYPLFAHDVVETCGNDVLGDLGEPAHQLGCYLGGFEHQRVAGCKCNCELGRWEEGVVPRLVRVELRTCSCARIRLRPDLH